MSGVLTAETFSDGFEEDLDNDSFPDKWRKTLDESHPRYNEIILDNTTSHSGGSSTRVNILGKNAQLISKEFFLVEPNKTYIISGWLKMQGFASNHAYISISWFDEMGTLIKKGKRSSYVTGDTDWVNLTIHLNRIPDNCRFIKIQCNLEGNDLTGTCWFDDISLKSHLILEIDNLNHPGNIFFEDEPVEFIIRAKNFREGSYTLNYRVLNYQNEPVIKSATMETVIKAGGLLEIHVSPNLPSTGYYKIETSMSDSAGNPVTEMEFGLGVIPVRTLQAIKSSSYSGSFGLVFDPYLSDTYIPPKVVSETGVKKMKVLLWSGAYTESQAQDAQSYLKTLIPQLFSSGIEITGVLAYPSPEMQKKLTDKPGQVFMYDIFNLPPDVWADSFLNTLKEHREFIPLWQFGDDKDPSFTGVTDFSSFIESLDEIARIETKFLQIGIPLQEQAIPFLDKLKLKPPLTFVSLNMDKLKSPEELLTLKQNISAGKINTKYITVRIGESSMRHEMPGPSPLYTNYSAVEWQLVDLVKKAVFCSACGEFDAYFVTPYELIFDEQGMPTSAFYTLRACSDILGGAEFVQSNLIEAEGVQSYVFEKNNTGIIALWTDSADEIIKDLYISKQAIPQIGMTGEYTILPEGDRKSVRITRTPSFIIVPEPAFLQTQLSVRLLPPSVESKTAYQEIKVIMTNHFNVPMNSVKTGLALPAGWNVKTAAGAANSIEPHASCEFVFYIQVPANETSGVIGAEIGLEFDITSPFDTSRKPLYARIYRSLNVIPQIDISHSTEKTAGGSAVKLRVEIQNNTKDTLSLRCYLTAPGMPPFENSLVGLAPASKKEMYFLLPAKGMKDYRIFIKDTGGNYFTAKKIMIE